MSNYVIYSGKPEFVPEYTKLFQEFEEETKTGIVTYETVANLFYTSFAAGIAVVNHLSKDDKIIGLIAGVISSTPYDATKTILTEFAWYVTKKERNTLWSIRLFKSFEKTGIDLGVDYVSAALRMNLIKDKNLQKLYEKFGYEAVEMNFLKKV